MTRYPTPAVAVQLPSTGAIIGLVVLALLTVGTGRVGRPVYEVRRAQNAGDAELAQADQNRQITVAQARAKAESAHFETDAKITSSGNSARIVVSGTTYASTAITYCPHRTPSPPAGGLARFS